MTTEELMSYVDKQQVCEVHAGNAYVRHWLQWNPLMRYFHVTVPGKLNNFAASIVFQAFEVGTSRLEDGILYLVLK